ncbi:hypothetical protein SAMN07250955_11367 [Arboricoccus pini]|uniref:DUF6468 domain-containing protein n=1 Tax=Arboricoccus pini TaxID=1963835 RepID=A0A212RSM0_9PROT|nr:DUF6468 domain-containing protein [Arboricoccus pini]SNB75503.1 hypothetical protein SAMN07250955_11367 [Arboricoccus pini]
MNEFIIDLILLVVLTCSIAWCAVVHRRLKKIGFERSEVASFIQGVDTVVARAEAAMARLKVTAEEVAHEMTTGEDEARHRLDELNKLISAAMRVSQRLETSMNTAYRRLAEVPSRAGAVIDEEVKVAEVPQCEPSPMPAVTMHRRPVSSDLLALPAEAAEPEAIRPTFDELPLGMVEREKAPSLLAGRPRHRSTVNSILNRLARHAPAEPMFEPVDAM